MAAVSNSVRTWGYKFHFSILILFPLGACPEVELLDYRIILFLIFKDLYTIFQWQPTPVLLPGKSHGQRSLVGYSPWGREKLDTTSLSLFTFVHWRRKWQPTPVLLAGKSHGQRSLVGYSPWGHKEPDTTEQL